MSAYNYATTLDDLRLLMQSANRATYEGMRRAELRRVAHIRNTFAPTHIPEHGTAKESNHAQDQEEGPAATGPVRPTP